MAKHLVVIMQAGGMDGLHFLNATDAPSQAQISALRGSAPALVPNYTPEVQKTGNLTENSAVVTGIDTSGLSVGMFAYGSQLSRQRQLTIASIGSGEVTLSGVSYASSSGPVSLTFKGARYLYRTNESPSTGRSPALHLSQHFLADAINVPDTPENAGKVKAAVVANIAPIRKRTFKNPGGSGVLYVMDVNGVTSPATTTDIPAQLTSHNDQQYTWQANSPEGAIEGWGGGIADTFLAEISGSLNVPLATVTTEGGSVFSAGTTATPFPISSSGLIRKVPGYTGGFTEDPNLTSRAEMLNLAKQAMTLVPESNTHDLMYDYAQPAQIALNYQDVLVDVIELTDPPSTPFGGYSPSGSMGPSDPAPFMRVLKQAARMVLANNPNRGFTANRTGGSSVVTLSTEITIGVANRLVGETKTVITASNHRLFSSNNSTLNLTDSVVVLGDGSAIDTSIPSAGYKITLEPSDPNNKFYFTSTQTTALVNAPVTVRLKHNFSTRNSIYITAPGFDTTVQQTPYQVQSIIDDFSLTVSTTATTALTNLDCKPKLINLPKQVIYTTTQGINWDTHLGTNEGSLMALDTGLSYYNSLIERMVDADVVTASITDFGRTMAANAGGTDHGWGAHTFVFGKSVKGNRIYGTIPDYDPTGDDVDRNMLIPTTAVYQYGATMAKWMGASDAEVLDLFPDLANWPTNEWYLGFL